MNQVTYIFRDGTKQSTPISKHVFFNEQNKKRSKEQVVKIIQETAHDLHAVKYVIS